MIAWTWKSQGPRFILSQFFCISLEVPSSQSIDRRDTDSLPICRLPRSISTSSGLRCGESRATVGHACFTFRVEQEADTSWHALLFLRLPVESPSRMQYLLKQANLFFLILNKCRALLFVGHNDFCRWSHIYHVSQQLFLFCFVSKWWHSSSVTQGEIVCLQWFWCRAGRWKQVHIRDIGRYREKVTVRMLDVNFRVQSIKSVLFKALGGSLEEPLRLVSLGVFRSLLSQVVISSSACRCFNSAICLGSVMTCDLYILLFLTILLH